MSSSNDNKANNSNQFEVNTCPLSKNSTPVESVLSIFLIFKMNLYNYI